MYNLIIFNSSNQHEQKVLRKKSEQLYVSHSGRIPSADEDHMIGLKAPQKLLNAHSSEIIYYITL